MSMQWRTSLRSDSAPGSRTSSPVGTGPRPSARVHRREVDEFHREVRAQQQSIEELTAALTAESEMALASHPATVADSPGSAASLLPDESLRVDSLEAAIEALESRVMNMEAEARRANERASASEEALLGEQGLAKSLEAAAREAEARATAHSEESEKTARAAIARATISEEAARAANARAATKNEEAALAANARATETEEMARAATARATLNEQAARAG